MGYMRLCIVVALLLIVLTGVISAQQSPTLPAKPISDSPVASSSGAADSGFQERNPRYRLHKSDVIDVEFTFSPEFNQTLTVQPDGYISMKGAGEVQAENKTLAELSRAIASAYGGILHDPVITISLKDFDKPFFLASGQVGKPGKYELRSDTTVTEARGHRRRAHGCL